MQEILKELFHGNVHPNEKQFIRNSDYGKALIIVSDCEEKLMTLLSGKELELFEKLMKAQGDSSHVNGREKFMEGFRLGARIALEIMATVPNGAEPVALCVADFFAADRLSQNPITAPNAQAIKGSPKR